MKHLPRGLVAGWLLCRFRPLLVLVMWLPLALGANAAPLTYIYEGMVDTVPPELAGAFNLGDPFRVEFTFDSETVDNNPDAAFGHYLNTLSAITVTVGTYTATGSAGHILITNDFLASPDNYRVEVRNSSMVGLPVNGYSLDGDQLPLMVLSDPTQTAFTSDALPLMAPDPVNFSITGANLRFDGPILHAVIDSLGANLTIDCAGFLPPFENPLSLKNKVKRAIPLNVTLTDADGYIVTDTDIDAPPVVNVLFNGQVFGEVPPDSDDLMPLGAANEDNQMRYDPETGQWVYVLGTKQFTAEGTYNVVILSGDTAAYTLNTADGNCAQSFVRRP